MDHSHMDHGGHSGHGGMDMGDGDSGMCSMNMLFTWDYNNLCIVFKGWRVTGIGSLIFSILAIVLLTAGYELVREASRRYEERMQKRIEGLPRQNAQSVDRQAKIGKAALYAVQVFYSFFIMLLFMTYNGWIMLAVALGAFVGYLAFSNASATKSAACH